MIPSIGQLVKENPAQKWQEEIFSAHIDLPKGDVLRLRFDTEEDNKEKYLNGNFVYKIWREVLVMNLNDEDLEHLDEICEDIAETFNDRIAVVTEQVRWHVAQASIILIYLATRFYIEAAAVAQRLCDDLIFLDESKGSKIWGDWLNSVGIFLKDRIEPEIGEIGGNTSERY